MSNNETPDPTTPEGMLRIAKAYKELFDMDSEAAQIVLADIMSVGGVFNALPLVTSVNGGHIAYNEGLRQMALHIYSNINMPSNKVQDLYIQIASNNG